MKYLVKTTYTATANHPHEVDGTQQVWYTGKGGYVSQHMNILQGWSKRHFAEKHIEDQLAFHNDPRYTQNEAWDIECEVVEI